MDGYELGKKLRDQFGDKLRFVALTGYGHVSDEQRSVEAGFDAHLVKPIVIDQLQELLDRLSGENKTGSGIGNASARTDADLRWRSRGVKPCAGGRSILDARGGQSLTNTERTPPQTMEQVAMKLDSEADRQAFLARAGRTLLSSLDYRETLQKLADLAVPTLGDWCAVDMVREDGGFARLAVTHSEPEKVKLAHELWDRYPPNPADPSGLPHVIRTGVAELVSEIPPGLLEGVTHDAEHLEIIQGLGLKSYMVLPLTAKGTVLGALTLVQAESGRSYREDELPFAAEFARLAAIAVDNARLFEGQNAARARAEASEETFRTFIDNLPELAWTALADGYIDFYNRRWYEYTGTTFEQMQGWGWETVHDPEYLPAVTARWKESIATGEPFEMEFPLIGANKLPRWFLTRVSPLRDKTGRIVRWFGTNTDVDDIRSARALAEEMATQSHDSARQMIELRRDKERALQRVAQLEAEIQTLRT